MMKFRFVGIALALTLVVGLACSEAGAEERIPLIDATDADAVWSFNHGAEFPGATGSLSIDPEAERQGNASLKLVGDFTQGGGYVQAGRQLGDGIDIRELSFWVKSPGTDRFTLRLGDASGQTHQIVLKTEPGEEWQRVVLPLERFFERRGQADAVTGIAKYESWGGAKDGNWHGPAKAIYLLLSNGGANQVRTLWLNEVVITPKPMPVPGAEMRTEVSLEEFPDWKFSLGQEFPGAKGSLTEVESEERSDLKLSGDFTGGGAYVAAIRNLADLGAAEVPALHLRYRSANAKSVTIQLVDGGGQTHQRRGFSITGDGEWHDLTLKPAEFAGGDRWGGANDGQWHGVIRQLVISLTADSDKENKRPEIQLAKVRAEVVQPVFAQPAAFTSDFETAALGDEWVVSGDVKIEAGALRLSRTLDAVEQACSVTGPAFPASPGQWEVSLVTQADLKSPDNSYNAVVQLECLDSAGKIVERFTLVDGFGQRDRETVRKLIELPKGVVAARFQAQLNKAHGEFLIDDLAAAYLAPAPQRDDRISRVLFSTAQLGNLLFPDDSREVGVTIEARKPLRDDQKSLSWVVRDYWGAEQNQPVTMMLGEPEKKKDTLVYETSIDLSGVPLEIGRYYELHATIPLGENAEPFRNHTSLAILPEAVTRQYPPEEIPFTSRNWDNRISEYIRLTDRLGIRICGLWGGWSATPPYQAEAPGLKLCRELGMGWLTTTPIKHIERGSEDYTEEGLRQGVRNFIAEYGKERPLIINLGNEPHGTGERVKKNVEAYRIVYEEIKKVDPTIPVVATSVEPNEEYFKNGYGQWCDAYDFHIYEASENVRRTMEEYGELMKQYDVVKPIWSTELGLNSQGQPRHAVAIEVFKKLSTFFAAGGENVSWFGLLYPDPDGKQHGSSGDSHNVFDCRFNRYAPRLDAVAYYHMVNAISIKKFVEEKRYEGGVHAILFRGRDGRCLQVLWKDAGIADVEVPLAGASEVQVIRIDGRRSALNAKGEGITITVSTDPMLLLYEKGPEALATALAASAVRVTEVPETVKRGQSIELATESETELSLIAPPFWKVETSGAPFKVVPPVDSDIREAEVIIKLEEGRGELYRRITISEP